MSGILTAVGSYVGKRKLDLCGCFGGKADIDTGIFCR